MRLVNVNILILCIFLGGCSTLQTLDYRSIKHWPGIEMYNECKNYELHGIKQQIVYSGLRYDIAYIVYPFTCSGESCWGATLYPLILPYHLVDLPFSLIADTIALPYTGHILYKICPNVSISDLNKRQELLCKRIDEYYFDYSNAEHVWAMSSSNFKNNMSLNQFKSYFVNSVYMLKNEKLTFTRGEMTMTKEQAKVRMIDSKKHNSTYDYWVYENDNWYITKPNQKE